MGMHEQLTSRIASLLSRPLPMKAQTERQLMQHLFDSKATMASFLLCAAQVLEDHEIEILFAPLFTPTLDQRAELADLLWDRAEPVGPAEQSRLVSDLAQEGPQVLLQLPAA